MHKNKVIKVGSVFGDWCVTGEPVTMKTCRHYPCVCVCGTEKLVFGRSLRLGRSKGCGCKRIDRFLKTQKTPREVSRSGATLKKLPFKEDRLAHLYGVAYKNSIRDRKSFSGSDLDFATWKSMVDSPCFYCGEERSNVLQDFSNGKKLVSEVKLAINGIDRIDSSKPYTKGNAVTCCKYCNRMKSDMTFEDFLNRVNRISERFKNTL